MEQKLLADIELDVQELKCLMKSFSQEPSPTLTEVLKRNILQMQRRLEQLLQELDSDRETSMNQVDTGKIEKSSSPVIVHLPVIGGISIVENSSVKETSVVVNETVREVTKATVEEIVVAEAKKEELLVVRESLLVEAPHRIEETLMEKELSIKETPSIVIENNPIIEKAEEKKSIIEEKEEETDISVLKDEVKFSVLGESIKISTGLRSSISLNDSFRFSRELFDGDGNLMNRVIEQISVMSSYKTAVAFLSSKTNINEENEAHNDFLELLKKYFNQSV